MPLENELLNQGIERLQSGDYEAALNLLNRAIAENPQQPDSWYQKGLVLQKLGRYVEAVKVNQKFSALTRDLKRSNKSLKKLKSAQSGKSSKNLDSALEWFEKGVQKWLSGNFEDALINYDEGLEIQPENSEGWYARGFILHYLNEYEKAIASFDKALAIDPNDSNVWNVRGVSLSHSNLYEEAILSFDKAIELCPNDHQAWANKGITLCDFLARYEEATSSFEKALFIKPDFYEAWYNRGVSLGYLHRYEEAIASYDKALQVKPDYHNAWINRGTSVHLSLAYDQIIFLSIGATLNQHNTSLNQRGYLGQSATLEFGLSQFSSSSEEWGILQQALGEAHLSQSIVKEIQGYDPRPEWQKARLCLEKALTVLSSGTFPSSRLEALVPMIRVLLRQSDAALAQAYRKEATKLLQSLLNQALTPCQKDKLEAKFSGFSQIEVDVWLESGELVTALETAERYKNRCLTWILEAWNETVISPGYAAMTALCTPTHAVIYWHLNPDSLTTFLLTHESNSPEVIECDRTSRSQKFIAWMQIWQNDYRDYASKKLTRTERESHPWQIHFIRRLNDLQQILQIEAIAQKLPETVQFLILIPHRDLHLLPLHLLFPSHLNCTYLPSIQIGLNLLKLPSERKTYVPLLSIEDPKTEQDEMPFAQLESVIVRHLLKDSVRIGPHDASTETVLSRIKEPFATLHFTGHGAYNARNPADSAFALTDGLITAKTISQLDLSSYRLIVLAACETALTGNDDIKTEYVGLASTFLKAGAANVLSTLWPVDEISSTWLIIRFYQFLLSGDSLSTALNHAQSWLRTVTWEQLTDWIILLSQLPGLDQGQDILAARANNTRREGTIMGPNQPTKYSHPFYWAGFTLTGID